MKSKVLIVLILSIYNTNFGAQLGVNTPVVDIVGIKPRPPVGMNMQEWFEKLPFAWINTVRECPRIYQALFNQIVDVLEEESELIKIKIPDVLVSNPIKNMYKEPLTGWALKKYFSIPINPEPLTNKNSLTLLDSWYDEQSKQWFSAGTRFKRSFNDSQSHYGVTFMTDKQITETRSIPVGLCLTVAPKTLKERQQLMVQLLKQWARQDRVIAYVWGGASIGRPTTGTPVYISQGWFWSDNAYPHHGIDCSMLILRAAQAAQLPYFYRNTTTLATHLRALKLNESLENGDLIWAPGHVMIISDVAHNEFIEAQGYSTFIGKIHTQKLKLRYRNITTYADLVSAFHAKRTLERIWSDGSTKPLTHWKILKFSSIFSNIIE